MSDQNELNDSDAGKRQLRRRKHDRNQASYLKLFHEPLVVNKYNFIRTIGEGNFAKVKLAVNIRDGTEVAIKVVDKQELTSSGRKKVSVPRQFYFIYTVHSVLCLLF